MAAKKIKKIELSEQAKELLKKAKSNGFVTQEEVLAIFPKAEDHIAELDEFYDQLLIHNIDLFETTMS